MLEDDPGWGFSWQTVLLLIPYFGLFYRRRLKKRAQDGLIMLRQLFTSFCVSIVLFGVLLAFLYPSYKQPRHPQVGVALGLLVAGVASALSDLGSSNHSTAPTTPDWPGAIGRASSYGWLSLRWQRSSASLPSF